VDYSWCSQSDTCSKDGIKHFDAQTLAQKLNEAISKPGCFEDGDHNIYYITDTNFMDLESNPALTQTIKQHIYTVGPVIGGYHVLDNFKSGHFELTKGVYIDSVDYENQKRVNPESLSLLGDHAVVILGWGIEKDIKLPGESSTINVPYWFCRNSWGDQWGQNNGFFKIAMFPVNKISQFDKVHPLTLPNGSVAATGGFVTFKPSFYKEFNFPIYPTTQKLSMPSSFYKNDPTESKSVTNKEGDKKKASINWKLIGGILGGIIVCALLFILLRRVLLKVKKRRAKSARSR